MMSATTFYEKLALVPYEKLSKERGIPIDWLQVNCERGFDYWLIKGIGNAPQIKRDIPKKDKNGKEMKYESLPGSQPGLFCPRIPEGEYNPYQDASYTLPQIITEGHFKAIIGALSGLRVYSVAGVWNGLKRDKDGKRELLDIIQKFIEHGRKEFIIAFDADAATNKDVARASLELAKAITSAGGSCTIATGQWTVEEGKGMDDFLQKNGIEEFRKRLERALSIDEYEAKYLSHKANMGDAVAQVEIGLALAERLRGKLMYNTTSQRWLAYGLVSDGVWAELDEKAVMARITAEIRTQYPSAKIDTAAKIKSVAEVISWHLHTDGGNTPNGIIPFNNGVLNIASMSFEGHSPANNLTWCLPRDYDANDRDWSGIQKFILESVQGREADMKILNCFAAAILRGKSHLQKYLHLLGLPGSGKGTFFGLVVKLIGSQNTKTSSIPVLCGNQFESAGAYGKRLLLFPDEQPFSGNIGTFLNATGREYLRLERKGKDATQFIFDGLCMVSSNAAVFNGSNLKAIQRRQVLVRFDGIPNNPDTMLSEKLENQLGAWTNYLLSIPESEVDDTLLNRGERGKLLDWAALIQASSLAAWVDEYVVKSENAYARVGNDKNELSDDDDLLNALTLYGSYCAFCKRSSLQPFSLTKFSPELMYVLAIQLKWIEWREKTEKNSKGHFIRGIRLRMTGDSAPTVSDDLVSGCDDFVTTSVTTSNPCHTDIVTTMTTCGGVSNKCESENTYSLQSQQKCDEENFLYAGIPSKSSYSSLSLQDKGLKSSLKSSLSRHQPVSSRHSEIDSEQSAITDVLAGVTKDWEVVQKGDSIEITQHYETAKPNEVYEVIGIRNGIPMVLLLTCTHAGDKQAKRERPIPQGYFKVIKRV